MLKICDVAFEEITWMIWTLTEHYIAQGTLSLFEFLHMIWDE